MAVDVCSVSETTEELAARFAEHMANDRGAAQNTVAAYSTDIAQFVRYLNAHELEVDQVSQVELTRFLDELAAQGISQVTRQRKTVSLRVFYRFLGERGICNTNPTAFTPAQTARSAKPDVLSRAEAKRLVERSHRHGPTGHRDRAMLELLYGVGLRASELLGVELDDLEMAHRVVHVRGHAARDRVLPLGRKAHQALRAYLNDGRPKLLSDLDEAHVFLNFRGGPLTRQGLYKIIAECAKVAELPGRVSPHTLRHTCAAHMLAGGCDPEILTEFLGLADHEATNAYCRLLGHLPKVGQASKACAA